MPVLYILPKTDCLLYWIEECPRERVKLFPHQQFIPRCFWKAATRGELSKLSTWNETVGFGWVRRELWLVGYPSQTCKMRVRNPQHKVHDPTNLALECSASSPDTSTFRCLLPAILRFLHFLEHSACSCLSAFYLFFPGVPFSQLPLPGKKYTHPSKLSAAAMISVNLSLTSPSKKLITTPARN